MNASSSDTGRRASTNSIGRPPRTTSPKAIRFQEMAAVGLISLTAGAPGVRAIRKSSRVCAPATDDLASSIREGRSSEWVKGTFNPIPPVPAVPILT